MADTVKYARQALSLMPEGDHIRRGTPTMLLGIASWTDGDLDEAFQSFADGLSVFQKAGNIPYAVSGTFILADIRVVQGRLHEAIDIYQKALQLAKKRGDSLLPGTAELYLGLSDLYRELGDLVQADDFLAKSEMVIQQTSLTQYRMFLAQARINEAKGAYEEALEQLAKAEHLYIRNPIPDVKPISALRTRLWIKLGRLAESMDWAKQEKITIHDTLSYLREFEHATLARVLLAHYQQNHKEHAILDYMELLERLLKAAEEGGRTGSIIEILILQAVAYQLQNDLHSAMVPFERAMRLAEPEGYVRIFIDEGQPMVLLLTEAAAQGIMPEYTDKLLAFLETEE
jgi:LuxR family maltose regulon positive regulatory protein